MYLLSLYLTVLANQSSRLYSVFIFAPIRIAQQPLQLLHIGHARRARSIIHIIMEGGAIFPVLVLAQEVYDRS